MNRLGDYKLRRRLAVGGMGEVYLGEKIGPEGFVKPVVIKCVLPQLSKDDAFVQLFLDEARVAALLNHPNIAQVYDFGEADGIYYMAMEYVPGYTIDDIRRKHQKIGRHMPIEHVACIASQACQGLEYAHSLVDAHGVSLGLVHRDVSPHNVMVSVDGGVKIVDFGIAKARAGLTRVEARGAVGKFGYMSPEQSRGESVDGRTDIFSLGVCIWELATNLRLHNADLKRPPNYDANRPLFVVSSARKDMPKQFDRLLQSALAIDRDARFADCHEMHIELERFMAAMIHYAGHAALAEYIKELVEGKYDVPNSEKMMGGLVEPVSLPNASPDRHVKQSGVLGGAQKYEEVFGSVCASAPSSTGARIPKVPESLKSSASAKRFTQNVKPPDRLVKKGATTSTERRELMEEGLELELDLPTESPHLLKHSSSETRAPRFTASRPRKRPRGLSGTATFLLALFFCGLGIATWTYQGPLLAQLDKLKGTGTKSVMSTKFRITTMPKGGEVYLDGKRQGSTPLIVEFLPEIPQYLEVKKSGLATHRQLFSPSIAKGVREMNIAFRPRAKLVIQSKPMGGTVLLNGTKLPSVTTPVTLKDVPADEDLKITVEKQGIPAVTLGVRVPKHGTRKLFFNLKGK